MLAVSIIVLSVSCGHYSLLSDCPIPSLLLLLLLLQTPLLKMQMTAVLLLCSHGSLK